MASYGLCKFRETMMKKILTFIFLIGIMSNKNSILYKNSNIKLHIPEVEESGHGIVPTSSTAAQLSIGDALAIALMLSLIHIRR